MSRLLQERSAGGTAALFLPSSFLSSFLPAPHVGRWGCGVENANGRIRRWLPRATDLDALDEADIQEIAMTINLTPRKCLGYRSPVEAFLSELGRDVELRFA